MQSFKPRCPVIQVQIFICVILQTAVAVTATSVNGRIRVHRGIDGVYAIGRAMALEGGGESTLDVVWDVRSMNIINGEYVGETSDGKYFMFAPTETGEPHYYANRQDWARDLSMTAPSLLPPAAFEDPPLPPPSVPLIWENVVLALGAGMAIVNGLVFRKEQNALLASIAVGVIASFVAEVVIRGGGPDAWLSMFALPVLFLIISKITFRLVNRNGVRRNWWQKWVHR